MFFLLHLPWKVSPKLDYLFEHTDLKKAFNLTLIIPIIIEFLSRVILVWTFSARVDNGTTLNDAI